MTLTTLYWMATIAFCLSSIMQINRMTIGICFMACTVLLVQAHELQETNLVVFFGCGVVANLAVLLFGDFDYD